METILNYLETMFASLPQTSEVFRAKQELAAMMEDKYNELLAEGKSDNEAVGIVISEFGNLKELAEELGIQDIYTEDEKKPEGRYVGDTEVRDYLSWTKRGSRGIGFGVMLCIFSPILLILLAGMQEAGMIEVSDALVVALGVGVLLILVAVAVGFFIYYGISIEKYDYLKKENITMSEASFAYVRGMTGKIESMFLRNMIAGVTLCIVSVIPLIVIGAIYEDNDFYCIVAVALLLFLIGIAVFLFITGGMEQAAVKALLQEGEYTTACKEANKMDDKIGGIYWPIITAIYLLWSFVTGYWGITWIIWPIAGVLYAAVIGIYHAVKKN